MNELGISFLTNHFKPDWNGRYITSIARCWCPPSSRGIVQWRPSTRKSGWGLRQQTWGDCFCCKNITWLYPHNTYFNVYMYSFHSLLHMHNKWVSAHNIIHSDWDACGGFLAIDIRCCSMGWHRHCWTYSIVSYRFNVEHMSKHRSVLAIQNYTKWTYILATRIKDKQISISTPSRHKRITIPSPSLSSSSSSSSSPSSSS